MSQQSTKELLERWKNGDQQAANVLHCLYWQQLLKYASSQLSDRLAARVSPDDIPTFYSLPFPPFFGEHRKASTKLTTPTRCGAY